jgi:hypothetical protein
MPVDVVMPVPCHDDLGGAAATLVSVFVRLRGGNALASFPAFCVGCATGAPAAAATGGVGFGGSR